MPKSTVDQIRQRFDNDVERFSNLETGQAATMDAAFCMDLVTRAAAAVTPHARDLLDIGCGAGNYSLKMLQQLPDLNVALVDLSRPMLDRAHQRVSAATKGAVQILQGDMRELAFPPADIILAAATLHHLRADDQWQHMFAKLFATLRPGGSLWIFDMVEQSSPALQSLMRQRYADYLIALKGGGDAGRAYQQHVFDYVEQEDTPRPLLYQLDLLKNVGFTNVDVLHKNSFFAAFGGQKPPR